MKKVFLDFAPGLHGHFVEFIINKYIYNVPTSQNQLFHRTGAMHFIHTDKIYQQNKVVQLDHFSALKRSYPSTAEKIIFINHSPNLEFVLLTNVYYRCSGNADIDLDPAKIQKYHENLMGNGTLLDFRNYWYSRLIEFPYEPALMIPSTHLPIFNFNYSSLFNLADFLIELNNLAKFLEMKFNYDSSLVKLWDEFIEKNQGWQLYLIGNSIIDSAIRKENKEIINDWKLHAYLNFKITKIFNIFDGPLFTNEKYPSTSIEFMKLIEDYKS